MEHDEFRYFCLQSIAQLFWLNTTDFMLPGYTTKIGTIAQELLKRYHRP
jgi:hypothetical protein